MFAQVRLVYLNSDRKMCYPWNVFLTQLSIILSHGISFFVHSTGYYVTLMMHNAIDTEEGPGDEARSTSVMVFGAYS